MNPEPVSKWLKSQGKPRTWLAEQCKVAKCTVDGWLANKKPRPIPKPSQVIIAQLMSRDTPVAPKFTIEQFAAMQSAAQRDGKSLEDWMAQAILEKIGN